MPEPSDTTSDTAPAKLKGDRQGNTVAAVGMGGVGKTMTAAALAHNDDVRGARRV